MHKAVNEYLFVISSRVRILELAAVEEKECWEAGDVILLTHGAVLGLVDVHGGEDSLMPEGHSCGLEATDEIRCFDARGGRKHH